MNAKLIDSLVQIINALSKEERASLEARLNNDIRTPSKSPDFANEPFVGMWKDRKDVRDSGEWVRQLRRSEWTKKDD